MNLPMQQPQGQPQGQPQAQGKPQGNGSFPKDRAEALKFSNDMLEVIYNDKINANLVKQIHSIPGKVPDEVGVGMIAAQLAGNRFADVRAQTGRPIEMKLAAGAMKAIVSELIQIADRTGKKLPPEAKVGALKAAVKMVDEASLGKPMEAGNGSR